jgi:hypothetical protein
MRYLAVSVILFVPLLASFEEVWAGHVPASICSSNL